MNRRIFQVTVVMMVLVTSFASAGTASAGSNCASYMTVQWGDTLSGIAVHCGTTVAAIQAANPGLGSWVYAGQVLCIPSGYTNVPVKYPAYGGTYAVQWGDTLAKIAVRSGVSLSSLLAVNSQIANPNLIYAGQVINLPSGVSVPPPQPTTTPGYPSTPVNSLPTLKIVYAHGMFIRDKPNGTIIQSAFDKDILRYRPDSLYIDSKWRVWVEVRLAPPTKESYTGWLLVKDQLGNYFTEPQIDY